MKFKHPLMNNNIEKDDIESLINFLSKKNVKLTQSKKVEQFESNWSKWLGVKYSIFVNSGSSANLITLAALRELYGVGEIIVPALTWVSDISSVIQNGFKPVFVDINKNNLCMNDDQVIKKINSKTRAVFITHAQGFNGLSDKLLKFLKSKSIPLIEDVCESHGASYNKKKLGSYGLISNFSFYYAHHMSTIEGGMVCTNDYKIYQYLRMLRSHGMVRETKGNSIKNFYSKNVNKLNKDFIFALAGYNLRNTEIGGVLGISQLRKLNNNIKLRNINHKIFLENLDPIKYRTTFDLLGSSNYAFNLILNHPNKKLFKNLQNILKLNLIEFRIGSAGGGNQLRQPYLKKYVKNNYWLDFPETEHIHFYGMYIGNFPTLPHNKILKLCKLVNNA